MSIAAGSHRTGSLDLSQNQPEDRPPVLFQRHRGEKIASVLFLAPAIIFLLFTSVYPLLYSLWLSLHSWNMTIPNSQPVWIGTRNYERLWDSPDFWNSVRVTLIFVFFAVLIEFILGMALALLATSRIRAMGLIRTAMLFPLMLAPVVAGVLWRTLFHSNYGVINYGLQKIGLPAQEWLGSPSQALPAVITVEIWQNLPVVTFVLAAGIQSLPVDLYKAAQVDGASSWQIFRRITLPLLKPVILVILLLRIMDAFKVFDIVFTMTYGGPGQTTELLSMLIYKTGFRFFQIGQASAMSWVFLVAILMISLVFIWRMDRE
jgi:multiple sugar transport system permease protein